MNLIKAKKKKGEIKRCVHILVFFCFTIFHKNTNKIKCDDKKKNDNMYIYIFF